MKFHFRIDHSSDGRIFVQCLETHFCGCVCLKIEEVSARASAVLKDYLGRTSPVALPPLPIAASDDEIAESLRIERTRVLSVVVEPMMAFAILLREARSRRRLFQAQVAKRLGLKNVSVYRRLEDPLRANPTLSTVAKVRRVFPELDLESVFEIDVR